MFKSRLIHLTLLVILGCAFNEAARADYNPVTITSGSYNQDIVVEKTAKAPLLQGSSIPANYCTNFITASMDGGTGFGGYTWGELGFPGNTSFGLPHPGTSFTAASPASPTHQFTMPASYRSNNCVFIASGSNGSLKFTSSAMYTSLSVLNSASGGPVSINYTISHADGSMETGNFSSLDWFNGAAAAYLAGGRVFAPWLQMFQTSPVNNAKIFATDIAVTNQTSAVTNISFIYVSGGRASIFALAGQSTGGGSYSPLSVSGFNQDTIVELQSDSAYTTATLDTGTNNTGNTWFEASYNPVAPLVGLPAAGSTITSPNLPDHHYTLAASYTNNNAALIDINHQSINITPVNPTNYTGFSLLTAGGNIVSGRVMTNLCILQHIDGSAETNLFLAYDWFEANQPAAFNANGRVNVSDTTLNNVSNTYPKLFESQFQLANTVSPVTNILVQYKTAPFSSSTTYIMAVAATAGSVAPIIGAGGNSATVFAGTTIVLSASITGGTSPVTNQWQFRTNGVWLNLTDSGNITGSTNTILIISNSAIENSGDYRFIASNIAGSAAGQPAAILVLSTLNDVTAPGDAIIDFGDAIPSPAGQGVTNAIDNRVSKYLNFAFSNTVPFTGPVGLMVTPNGGATIVNGLRIYTADDNPSRDPADFSLEGSGDGGVTYTLITSNRLALPAGRNVGPAALNPMNQFLQQVMFSNTADYTSYRLSFYHVKNGLIASSMQFGEVELLGIAAPVPPNIFLQPPAALARYAGNTATLSVGAHSGSPITYQWIKNGSTVAGYGTNLVLSGLSTGDSGSTYTCVITNIYGTTNSAGTTLTVIDLPTNSYPAAVLASSPLGYWRLGEMDHGGGNNGVTAHDYWGGNDGVYTNAELSLPGYPAVPSDTDTAARFGNIAGSDSYVGQIANIGFGITNGGSAVFSVEVWVNGPAQSTDAGIIAKGAGNGGEQFDLDTGNGTGHAFRFFVRDAGGGAHQALSAVTPDGNWHHLVGVCDQPGGSVKLYVDGVLSGQASLAAGSGLLVSASPVTLGSRQAVANSSYLDQFLGVIDEVAIYHTALSAAQVQTHYYAAGIAPVITRQPTNTTIYAGSTAFFSVGARGTPALSYQWSENGQPIIGVTNSTLLLTNVPLDHDGYTYSVTITNFIGTTSSDSATLSVLQGPPQIAADISPLQLTAFAGMAASFTFAASGSLPLQYQWHRNSTNVPEANGPTYNFPVLLGTNTYDCKATNSNGSISSSTATVIGVDATNPTASFAINFHDFKNFGAYNGSGYTQYVPYSGQGAYNDPGNTWNGFGGGYTNKLPAQTSAGILTPVTLTITNYTSDNGLIWNYDDDFGNNPFQGMPGFLLGTAAIVTSDRTGCFTYDNVPIGNYDLFVYAANYDGNRGAAISLGGITKIVNNNPGINNQHPATNLIDGVTYTVFHNVIPSNGVVSGIWSGNFTNPLTGLFGEGDLAGLQLVKASVTSAPILSITRSGANILVTWSPAIGQLQAAGSLTSTFTNILRSTTPYTNSIQAQLFYRVQVQ